MKEGDTLISILRTHQLSLHHWKFSVGFGIISGFFSWLLGYALWYFQIDNFAYSKGGWNTIVFYHLTDNRPSLGTAMLPLGIHHLANDANLPPPFFNPTSQTHYNLSFWSRKLFQGEERFIGAIYQYRTWLYPKYWFTISPFFTLFRQLNVMQRWMIFYRLCSMLTF